MCSLKILQMVKFAVKYCLYVRAAHSVNGQCMKKFETRFFSTSSIVNKNGQKRKICCMMQEMNLNVSTYPTMVKGMGMPLNRSRVATSDCNCILPSCGKACRILSASRKCILYGVYLVQVSKQSDKSERMSRSHIFGGKGIMYP